MATKKEILEKHINKNAQRKLGVHYNQNMIKACIGAMEEYAEQQIVNNL